MLIGIYEDINNSLDKYLRLTIQIILIILSVYLFSLIDHEINFLIIDYLFELNSIFKYLFFSLSLLILINGFNFIDGLNGLMLSTTILLMSILCYYSFNKSPDIFFISAAIILAILPLFYFNFFYGKILAGDGGSYFLGFICGSLFIYSSKQGLIEPILIACILYYPVIELYCVSSNN